MDNPKQIIPPSSPNLSVSGHVENMSESRRNTEQENNKQEFMGPTISTASKSFTTPKNKKILAERKPKELGVTPRIAPRKAESSHSSCLTDSPKRVSVDSQSSCIVAENEVKGEEKGEMGWKSVLFKCFIVFSGLVLSTVYICAMNNNVSISPAIYSEKFECQDLGDLSFGTVSLRNSGNWVSEKIDAKSKISENLEVKSENEVLNLVGVEKRNPGLATVVESDDEDDSVAESENEVNNVAENNQIDGMREIRAILLTKLTICVFLAVWACAACQIARFLGECIKFFTKHIRFSQAGIGRDEQARLVELTPSVEDRLDQESIQQQQSDSQGNLNPLSEVDVSREDATVRRLGEVDFEERETKCVFTVPDETSSHTA